MLNTAVKDVEGVRSLVWFRNDLRILDHNGLAKASENSKRLFQKRFLKTYLKNVSTSYGPREDARRPPPRRMADGVI